MANSDNLMWGRAKQINSSLIVKLNGGSSEGLNMFTYNGSSGKTVNITPYSKGALPTTEIYTLIENNMYFITVHVTGVSIARDGGELQIAAPYGRYDEWQYSRSYTSICKYVLCNSCPIH